MTPNGLCPICKNRGTLYCPLYNHILVMGQDMEVYACDTFEGLETENEWSIADYAYRLRD